MGTFQEYDRYDALGLAGLVRKKDVTPAELCEEAIVRIERINPRINAVIYRMFDSARKSTGEKLPDGPFTGVPFLLKDLLTACAGFPLTMGSRAFQHYIPPRDSELMTRYKAAGVVVLGKTNTPEFGLMGITEPELHGPTRNPWNTDHTPGGSSGGSAAAVASGMVPMASGGDGGGSIRIPSSHCGLFGLKPTRGRTPTGPEYGQIWQGAAVEHVITRSVRDSAAMLDAISGPDIGAPYIIPGPQRPFLEEVGRDPGKLRIAFTTRSPLKAEVHPECRKAVEEAAKLLADLGHIVEEAEPAIDGIALAKSYFTMYYGEIAADIEDMKRLVGRKLTREDVEGPTWLLNLLGKATSAGEFVLGIRLWNAFARQMGAFHEAYDLYLTPTVAFPPVKIGELKPKPAEEKAMKVVNRLGLGRIVKLSGLAEKIAVESLAKTPYTQLANLTGQPAMSVPLHWTADGLPIGVQLIARFGDEASLFRLAGQLEKARPWFDRRPAI
ncbi:MAG TPA: amidase family protein [Deltaproteobacteria bacterium]|nr:amidase family protein [Deltaproteobacteria bacterium]HPR53880.1 amidase family protein [Deltaproteobacteria bacterium]HXK48715.1 amidase family protein [Deltaproteobacteria bacterium]